ncbi:MAG: hypothetical protein Q7T03_07560 [Deltaproteobacteria bacterium]|nr:hypothetical protein [Deltaproteobacteria bacterium]
MVGVGLSIGGFLIKSEAAETPKGAAWNKIALNLGSFAAGPILAISILTPSTFFSGGLVLLVLCAIISWKNIHRRNKIATQRLPKKPTLQKKIAWSLIGFSIGIKLFGIFSILPQTILKTTGQIPAWYGIMISLNSLVIIFLQLPIIHQLTRHKNPDRSAFYALIAGMFILGSASFFRVDTLYGAILWTLLCSVIECSASYLDSSASKDGALIFKEASVGLGAATVVAVMRVCPAEMGAMIVGGLGLLALTIGMALKWKYFSIASVKFSR